MQESVVTLEKRAIKAGVATNWKLAKELNQELLKIAPNNIDAKNRLGKALLELKEYSKAVRYFKEVLENDPLNHTAQKNLTMAKLGKTSKSIAKPNVNLILEPGTYAETTVQITAKRLNADSFYKGQSFKIKTEYKNVKILYQNSGGELAELGELDNQKLRNRIIAAKKDKIALQASYLRGQDKQIIILVVANKPIFEAEKQDVKPYMKRDFIEDSSEGGDLVQED